VFILEDLRDFLTQATRRSEGSRGAVLSKRQSITITDWWRSWVAGHMERRREGAVRNKDRRMRHAKQLAWGIGEEQVPFPRKLRAGTRDDRWFDGDENELYTSASGTGEFNMAPIAKKERNVISALQARSNFGKLLNRVDKEGRSILIEKRGTPRAVLLSIRDYMKLAAPEPEILRVIGENSKRRGTDKLTSKQIDRVIQAARKQMKKRRWFRFDSF
jgi:prevent-host-death family protein